MNGDTVALKDDEIFATPCLFQYWDKNIPDAVAELTRGVAEINAGLNYRFFDDDSAIEYINKEYGADICALYESCAIPAMRADLFRYCFLATHGGFYVDADFRANASIAPIFSADWKGCLYLRERGLTNSMMYFRGSCDPLAEKILEVALENITTRSSNNVWQVTGPYVLQSIQADKANQHLFDDVHLMQDEEFAQYFKLAPYLDYKNDDTHWLVARQKGISIYKD